VDFPALAHSSDVSDPNSWAHITHVTKEAAAVAKVRTTQQTHSRDDCPDEQANNMMMVLLIFQVNALTHRQRLRNKRRRVRSRDDRATVGQSDYTTDDADGGAQNRRQARRKQKSQSTRLLVGKKRPDTTQRAGPKLTAAKPYLRKAVFCVDNVYIDVTVDDLSRFVRDMDVNVITCYKVKPRRSPWQRQVKIMPADRNTFRLCVAREDVDKVLNDEMWPEHTSILSWTFLKPGNQQQSTNAQDQPLPYLRTDTVKQIRRRHRRQLIAWHLVVTTRIWMQPSSHNMAKTLTTAHNHLISTVTNFESPNVEQLTIYC